MSVRGPYLVKLVEHLLTVTADTEHVEPDAYGMLLHLKYEVSCVRKNVETELQRAHDRLVRGQHDFESGELCDSILHTSGSDLDVAVAKLRGVEDQANVVFHLCYRAEARHWIEYSIGCAFDNIAQGEKNARVVARRQEEARRVDDRRRRR